MASKRGLGGAFAGLGDNIFTLLRQSKADKDAAEEKKFRDKQYTDLMERYLKEDARTAKLDTERNAGIATQLARPGTQMPESVRGTPYEAAFGQSDLHSQLSDDPSQQAPWTKLSTPEDEQKVLQLKQLEQALAAGKITMEDAATRRATLQGMNPRDRTRAEFGFDPSSMTDQERMTGEHKNAMELARTTGGINLANQKALLAASARLTPQEAMTAFVNSMKIPIGQDESVWEAQVGPLRAVWMDIIRASDPAVAAKLDEFNKQKAISDEDIATKAKADAAAKAQPAPSGPGMMERMGKWLSGAAGSMSSPKCPNPDSKGVFHADPTYCVNRGEAGPLTTPNPRSFDNPLVDKSAIPKK